ncbi:conserved membrane protein, unknown function [Hepatocystis sp. ex Piliocolobus tephrosceles]|nr:conserved membrane protein, unknown function [Hepatocystis sp. ex Piliocolobus tephrosceles]
MIKKCLFILVISLISIALVLYEKIKHENSNIYDSDNKNYGNVTNNHFNNELINSLNYRINKSLYNVLNNNISLRLLPYNKPSSSNFNLYDKLNNSENKLNKCNASQNETCPFNEYNVTDKSRYYNIIKYSNIHINNVKQKIKDAYKFFFSNIKTQNKTEQIISLFIELIKNFKLFLKIVYSSSYNMSYAYGVVLISLLKIFFLWYIIIGPYLQWTYFKLKKYYINLNKNTQDNILIIILIIILFYCLVLLGVIKYISNKLSKIYKYISNKLLKIHSFLFNILPYIISLLFYSSLVKILPIHFLSFFIHFIFFPLPSLYSIVIIIKYIYLPKTNIQFKNNIKKLISFKTQNSIHEQSLLLNQEDNVETKIYEQIQDNSSDNNEKINKDLELIDNFKNKNYLNNDNDTLKNLSEAIVTNDENNTDISGETRKEKNGVENENVEKDEIKKGDSKNKESKKGDSKKGDSKNEENIKKKNSKNFNFNIKNFGFNLQKKEKKKSENTNNDKNENDNKDKLEILKVDQNEINKNNNDQNKMEKNKEDINSKSYYDVSILLEYWLVINILKFINIFFFFRKYNKTTFIFEYFTLYVICINISEKLHEFMFLKYYKSSILVRFLKTIIIKSIDFVLCSLFNVRIYNEKEKNKEDLNKTNKDTGNQYMEYDNILMKISKAITKKTKLNGTVKTSFSFLKSMITENITESVTLPLYIKVFINLIIYMPQLILLLLPSFILKIYFAYFFFFSPIFGSLKCLEENNSLHKKIYYICYFFFYNIANVILNSAFFNFLPFYNLYKVLITIPTYLVAELVVDLIVAAFA